MAKKVTVKKKNSSEYTIKTLPWDEIQCIAVVGATGSGKTVTCFKILDQVVDRPKYIYNHPQPHILHEANVENIEELSLDAMQDCVLYIDEPQLCIGGGRNSANLLKLFSLARQRDINIIFSTSDTRFITKAFEAYIDAWIIKDIDYDSVKRGSKIKFIMRAFCYDIFPENIKLKVNEAIFYCRKFFDSPKKIKIPLPKYWSERFSKPYKHGLFSDQESIFPLDDNKKVNK